MEHLDCSNSKENIDDIEEEEVVYYLTYHQGRIGSGHKNR